MNGHEQVADAIGFDPFGRDPELCERMRPRFDDLLDRWLKVQVEGIEHVPAAGRVLLVASHGGALPWDAVVLLAALGRASGRHVRPLVEDPVMTAPFLGTLLTRLGCVRASQDNAARLLERDETVLVFPEGMQGLGKLWRQRHKLMRFGRGGFVRLALRTKAPILPVAVVGAEDTSPLLFKIGGLMKEKSLPYIPVTPVLPLPARWRIRVGAPIDANAEIPEHTDIAVSTLATRVRDQIQRDVDVLVQDRGSAY
ncbi:MAG: acyltransferase family protein [Deltaproteobacteria bacterium]|nr:acyltransferase family protein [Deltaproteobacteria bacterium]